MEVAASQSRRSGQCLQDIRECLCTEYTSESNAIANKDRRDLFGDDGKQLSCLNSLPIGIGLVLSPPLCSAFRCDNLYKLLRRPLPVRKISGSAEQPICICNCVHKRSSSLSAFPTGGGTNCLFAADHSPAPVSMRINIRTHAKTHRHVRANLAAVRLRKHRLPHLHRCLGNDSATRRGTMNIELCIPSEERILRAGAGAGGAAEPAGAIPRLLIAPSVENNGLAACTKQ